MKTLILGIGNPILTDDGVGIRVANEIKRLWEIRLRRTDVEVRKPFPQIEVMEASVDGISLLDYIVGYDKLIIIDSIKTEKGNSGSLYKLKIEDLSTSQSPSYSHGVNLRTAIELGKRLGYKIPEFIDIYAIEIEDNITFSEHCTTKVKEAIPRIVDTILKTI